MPPTDGHAPIAAPLQALRSALVLRPTLRRRRGLVRRFELPTSAVLLVRGRAGMHSADTFEPRRSG